MFEIVCIKMMLVEFFKINGKTGVHGIADAVNDPGAGKQLLDESKADKIMGHLVSHPEGIRPGERPNQIKILVCRRLQKLRVDGVGPGWKICVICTRSYRGLGDFIDFRQFSRAMSKGMTGNNLLNEAGTGPRHAHYENRPGIIIWRPVHLVDSAGAVNLHDSVKPRGVLFRVKLAGIQRIGLLEIHECRIVFPEFIKKFAECKVNIDPHAPGFLPLHRHSENTDGGAPLLHVSRECRVGQRKTRVDVIAPHKGFDDCPPLFRLTHALEHANLSRNGFGIIRFQRQGAIIVGHRLCILALQLGKSRQPQKNVGLKRANAPRLRQIVASRHEIGGTASPGGD